MALLECFDSLAKECLGSVSLLTVNELELGTRVILFAAFDLLEESDFLWTGYKHNQLVKEKDSRVTDFDAEQPLLDGRRFVVGALAVSTGDHTDGVNVIAVTLPLGVQTPQTFVEQFSI